MWYGVHVSMRYSGEKIMNESQKSTDNIITGAVGAFLGSLIGVACIVIVGQLGYVASVSGLVMGVCALKGYEKLGGGLSKKGAVVSILLVLMMTYLANRLDWAISLAVAAEADVFAVFRAMDMLLSEGFIEGSAYWGNLVLLYLFTLMGAVPAVIGGLKGDVKGDPWHGPVDVEQAALDTSGLEIFAADIRGGATRRLRASMMVSMLLGCVVGLALLLGSGEPSIQKTAAAFGCIFSSIALMCIALPYTRLLRSDRKVIARTAGNMLWQVDLTSLNQSDQFTGKNGAVSLLYWGRLSADEQERARSAIGRAIAKISQWGGADDAAVIGLYDLQVIRENRWYWKCSYRSASEKTKTIYIVKAYEGLALRPGEEPARGVVPFHWGLLAMALLLTAIMGGLGFILV